MPSTVIRDISYNVATRQLTVTFVTGRVYAYADVPPDINNAFRASGSKGRFFNLEIRDRFDCREITARMIPKSGNRFSDKIMRKV